MVTSVGSEQEFAAVTASGICVIDLYASWCGPCKAYAPRFAALAAFNKHMKFVKIDADQNRGVAGQFGVQAFPSFAVTKDGRQVGSTIRGANEQQIAAVVAAAGARFRTSAPPPPQPVQFTNFPAKFYVKHEPVKLPALLGALKRKNAEVPADVQLGEDELAVLDRLAGLLEDRTTWHSSKFTVGMQRILTAKLAHWPISCKAPALDLIRVACLHPHGAAVLGGAAASVAGAAVDAATSTDASNGLRTVAGRLLLNLFYARACREAVVERAVLVRVVSEAVPALLGGANSNIRTAGAVVLLNAAVWVRESAWASGALGEAGPRLPEPQGSIAREQVLPALRSALSGELTVQEDALALSHLVAAVGTVLCAGGVAWDAAAADAGLREALSDVEALALASGAGGAAAEAAAAGGGGSGGGDDPAQKTLAAVHDCQRILAGAKIVREAD